MKGNRGAEPSGLLTDSSPLVPSSSALVLFPQHELRARYHRRVRPPSDTPVDIDRLHAAILSRKTSDERWQLALDVTEYSRSHAMIAMLATCDGDHERSRIALVRMLYGATLSSAFGAALLARRTLGSRPPHGRH